MLQVDDTLAQQNKEFGTRLYQQILDIWVNPEIQRRQIAGTAPKPYVLRAAQILFSVSGGHSIRLNEEMRAVGRVVLKKGVKKAVDDPVLASDIDRIEGFELTSNDDPNCGHVTMVVVDGRAFIAFDLRYNRRITAQHLNVAREFLDVAYYCFNHGLSRAFADALFSAAELVAKALILMMTLAETVRKHTAVHSRFNKFAKLGNASQEFRKAFNHLADVRQKARYIGPYQPNAANDQSMLIAVHAALEEALRKSAVD